MKGKTLYAGMLAGALGLVGGQAAAVEPDAQFHLFPARGADIVAGILDGTFDFGEAVLFGVGGLYGDEGLFEDYLRDFLITEDGFLAEHGFLGAIIGGDGVAAGFTSPDGLLVGTLLELSGNYDAFHGGAHASSASASGLGGGSLMSSGALGGGGLSGVLSLPVNVVGSFAGI